MASFTVVSVLRPPPEEYEHQYRRGYWDGVEQAVFYLRQGATQRQIDHWLWNDLRGWRYGSYDDFVLPPMVVPWAKLRKAVLDAYNGVCVYCGATATHVDHIIPVSRGGGYDFDNLVAACARCNLRKRASTPKEAGMEILFSPSKRLELKRHYDWLEVVTIRG